MNMKNRGLMAPVISEDFQQFLLFASADKEFFRRFLGVKLDSYNITRDLSDFPFAKFDMPHAAAGFNRLCPAALCLFRRLFCRQFILFDISELFHNNT